MKNISNDYLIINHQKNPSDLISSQTSTNAQEDPYVTQTLHVQILSDLINVHVLKSFMEMDSNVYQYTQIVRNF